MPHRLILKVIKFQLPPPKRLGTVVKNILGSHHGPPPMSNRVNEKINFWRENVKAHGFHMLCARMKIFTVLFRK